MEKMTITEGLSEINLIKKKIIAKQAKIKDMLLRVEHLPDPFEKEGGSPQVILNETQGIGDLQNRLIKIRGSISYANLHNHIKIDGVSKSIHDWLIWKREIAKDHINFLSAVNRSVKAHLDQASKQPQVYKDDTGVVQLVKTAVNVHYPLWLSLEASGNETFEKLDGQLSLKNATIVIDI